MTSEEMLALLDYTEADAVWQIGYDKKLRRLKSLADCGSPWYGYSPATGDVRQMRQRCKQTRECPRCLAQLAWRQKEFIKTASIVKNLSFLICTTDEFKRLTKGKGKKSYKRFPGRDEGVEFLLLDSDQYDAGERIDFDWVLEQNWGDICFGRDGSNVSGSLISPKSEVNPAPFTIVEVHGIVCDAPQEEQLEVMEAAKEETSHLDPKTPAEVKAALMERFEAALARTKERGHNPRTYVKKIKLIHSEINWVQNFSINANNTDAETLPKYIQGSLDPPIAQN